MSPLAHGTKVLQRNLRRYALQQHSYTSVRAFRSSTPTEGVSTIEYGDHPLDLLIRYRGSSTTVVTFHAALSSRVRSIPYFPAQRLVEATGANHVAVADPSLRVGSCLKLAWYAGNAEQSLQAELPDILRHILDSHRCENVVFFGPSGGGFAALYYSHAFSDSAAVAVNPQTIIANYASEAVHQYGQLAFRAQDLIDTMKTLPERITWDLRDVYAPEHRNHVFYVQNSRDHSHVRLHLRPFLEHLPTSPRVHLLMDDTWGNGHVPPPAEELDRILSALVRAEGRWTDAAASAGFCSGPKAAELHSTPSL